MNCTVWGVESAQVVKVLGDSSHFDHTITIVRRQTFYFGASSRISAMVRAEWLVKRRPTCFETTLAPGVDSVLEFRETNVRGELHLDVVASQTHSSEIGFAGA